MVEKVRKDNWPVYRYINSPDIFTDREGFRRLSPGACKLYFYLLDIADSKGDTFSRKLERTLVDLNYTRNSFSGYRDELVDMGLILYESETRYENGQHFKLSTYTILQE